jgi:transposase InsO family protein
MTEGIPLTKEQEDVLKWYYQSYKIGTKKLYYLLKANENDLNISYRQVSNFLKSIPQYQQHRALAKTKHIKPIVSSGPMKILQIDLIDYSQNTSPNMYKYVLVIIDVFSRKCWLYPIKQKTAMNTRDAFLQFYNTHVKGRDYHNIRIGIDQGGEFQGEFNDTLKELGIKQHVSPIAQNQGVVERANQSIRRILERYNVENKKTNRLQAIHLIQDIYNTTIHSSLDNHTPNDVFFGDEKLKSEIRKYQKEQSEKQIAKSNTSVGIPTTKQLEPDDWVRIGKIRNELDKKQSDNYSEAIYTVKSIIKGRKLGSQDRYRLLNSKKEELKRTYYRQELLQIPKHTKDLDYSDKNVYLDGPEYDFPEKEKRVRKPTRRLVEE